MENKALALANELRTLTQTNMANPYTMLQPRANNDGTVTIKVKDKRSTRMLTVVVTEDE